VREMTAITTPEPSIASLASACEIAHSCYLRAMATATIAGHRYANAPAMFGEEVSRLKRAKAQAYGRLSAAKRRLDESHEALFNAMYRGDA